MALRFENTGKDYAAEAAKLTGLITGQMPKARTLLDVACGSGGHLAHLRNNFACEGVDIDRSSIDEAKTALPDMRLAVEDMEKLDLGRKFDVVTCLFSSIAYVETVERLNESVRRLASHVTPGGMLIIEPWIMPERWLSERQGAGGPDADKAIRDMASHRPVDRGQAAMRALAGELRVVERLKGQPKLGWFTFDEYAGALKASGVNYRFMEPGLTGRGLFVGALER